MVKNHTREAKKLVAGLGVTDLYSLYRIVLDQLQKAQSPQKDQELRAVKLAIYQEPRCDLARLHSIERGYGSAMAQDAGRGDMIRNHNPKRKKV